MDHFLRITFVLPGFARTPVGGFKVVYEYSNRLVARGHQVAIVHPWRLANILPPPLPNVYRRLRREARHLQHTFARPRLPWFALDKRVRMLFVIEPTTCQTPDADVVFATAWQTAEYVIQYPPGKGEKFYLVMDFDPWLGPKDRLEATWRQPFKIVTISRWLYDKVRGAGAAPNETVSIAVGIDHGSFRLMHNIAERPEAIAMMVASASYKAPQDGLRALEIVKRLHPQLESTVFGPSRTRPERFPAWIAYRGNVAEAELVTVYNRSRIFGSSSVAEGFALPPAEAMACGCAVASTDSGGIREYAEHEVNALLSPPRDPEALARNMSRLLEDDGLRQKIAVAGHRRIQDFTWERSTDLLERFIKKYARSSVDAGTPRETLK